MAMQYESMLPMPAQEDQLLHLSFLALFGDIKELVTKNKIKKEARNRITKQLDQVFQPPLIIRQCLLSPSSCPADHAKI